MSLESVLINDCKISKDEMMDILPSSKVKDDINNNTFNIESASLEDLEEAIVHYSYLNIDSSNVAQELQFRLGEKKEFIDKYYTEKNGYYQFRTIKCPITVELVRFLGRKKYYKSTELYIQYKNNLHLPDIFDTKYLRYIKIVVGSLNDCSDIKDIETLKYYRSLGISFGSYYAIKVVRYNKLDMLKFFADGFGQSYADVCFVYREAIMYNRIEILDYLYSKWKDLRDVINPNNFMMSNKFAMFNCIKGLEWLCERINPDMLYIARSAIHHDNMVLTKWVFEKMDLDTKSKGIYDITKSIINDNTELVELVLQNAKIDLSRDMGNIRTAIKYKRYKIIGLLMTYGYETDVINQIGILSEHEDTNLICYLVLNKYYKVRRDDFIYVKNYDMWNFLVKNCDEKDAVAYSFPIRTKDITSIQRLINDDYPISCFILEQASKYYESFLVFVENKIPFNPIDLYPEACTEVRKYLSTLID